MRGNDKTIYAKKLISGLACLLMVLTPQYSFAIDSSPLLQCRKRPSRARRRLRRKNSPPRSLKSSWRQLRFTRTPC